MWVESRQRTRGSARGVLRQELRRKGVDSDTIEEAVATIEPQAERARAVELVRVKARSLGRFDAQTRARRLSAMLQRRGYPPGLAFSVVREALDDLPGDLLADDGSGEGIDGETIAGG